MISLGCLFSMLLHLDSTNSKLRECRNNKGKKSKFQLTELGKTGREKGRIFEGTGWWENRLIDKSFGVFCYCFVDGFDTIFIFMKEEKSNYILSIFYFWQNQKYFVDICLKWRLSSMLWTVRHHKGTSRSFISKNYPFRFRLNFHVK